MNYKSYLKKEIEKAIFIEIKKDVTLRVKGNPSLKAGDYPLLPEDVVDLAQRGVDSLPAEAIIKGMVYVIACDRNFKYSDKYIEFLKSLEGIESYFVMNIDKNKGNDIKKSIIYATALCEIDNKKESKMNRVYLLMEQYDRTGIEHIKDEILENLEELSERYPEYGPPNFHLGDYYLDKDMDLAKLYFKKSIKDPLTKQKAYEILEKIRITDEYDGAVELVKSGNGSDALRTLIPYCDTYKENLDAKYYTAIAFRQIGDNYKAIYYLQELINVAERPEVYNEIGLNLAELGEFEAAREYFKKALRIKPDDSSIICNIGVCHLNLGDEAEAKKAFELASRINPKDDVAEKWLMEMEGGE